VPFLLLAPTIFSKYSFCVLHPDNRDDRHLLSLAMATDLELILAIFSRLTLAYTALPTYSNHRGAHAGYSNQGIANQLKFFPDFILSPTNSNYRCGHIVRRREDCGNPDDANVCTIRLECQ
jgi:hypothetical protein